MSNGSLSQEEINALLSGADLGADDAEETNLTNEANNTSDIDSAPEASSANEKRPADEKTTPDDIEADADQTIEPTEPTEESVRGIEHVRELTDMEKDALGEIANISMGTAATTLSQLLGKKVEITTPELSITTISQIIDEYPVPHVLINVNYRRELAGSNLLILSRHDGSVIVDLMMGGTGQNPSDQLNEIQISGISEAMNQMMGSAATSMSTVFDSVVDITTPMVHVSDDPDADKNFVQKNFDLEETVIRVSFRMVVDGIIDSVLLQIIPFDVAEKMIGKLFKGGGLEQDAQVPANPGVKSTQAEPPTPSPSQVSQAPSTPYQAPSSVPQAPQVAPAQPQMPSYTQPQVQPQPPTMVQTAQFSQLTPGTLPIIPSNLDLIYDVPLLVSVELGRTSKTIREILDLGSGSVVELDRLAGEAVDMAVNGKMIAKCEVVVINEMFGIKITEIISPHERFKAFD